ncbi:OmpA family protein [Silvimonas soli]|nr:OmpA family protein [Silvimonas soli]
MSFTALAVAAAMAASYLGNERLIQQIRDDIGSYRLTGYQMPGAKLGALRQLQADRDQLLSFARTGVPWRLSWGMYRGEGLLPLLEREIRGYAPPPPPPAMISLDSLSLFDSGKATLKPDANRVLMTALMSITANPEKQALIAGHTDNTGNPAINQKLSEARAIAVRDWFINMSSLPPSHFAVKGFGGSTPLAPNDSVANKARNRRVEITLVPDIPAH